MHKEENTQEVNTEGIAREMRFQADEEEDEYSCSIDGEELVIKDILDIED